MTLPKTPLSRRWLIAPVALLATCLSAQETEDDHVVELNPFEVNASLDDGFVAATSLAGGRLAGELKDTPAAYSVQTREFIDALNLSDLAEALEWTVNATSVEEEGRLAIFGNSDQTLSIRGITSPGRQRNYFPLSIRFDSYNLDRFDYSRGPNAILFGTGSFAGTPNVVTKRARLDKNFGRIEAQVGSWDHYRSTFDYNHVLNDKIAVRANLMWQDAKDWRDYQYDRRKAATVALTWELTDATTLSLEAEAGKMEENKPFTIFSDHFMGWDGTTVFPTQVTNATVPPRSVLDAAGVTRWGSDTNPYLVYIPELGGVIQNFANSMTTEGGFRRNTTGVGGTKVPTGARSPEHRDRPIIGIPNLYAGRFDAALAGSAFEVPTASSALSTDEPTLSQNYESFSGFLSHRFSRNVMSEIGLNVSSEDRLTNYVNGRDLDHVYIDINQTLPDGSPNPYFLEPFGQGRRARGIFGTDYVSGRAAIAYLMPETRFGQFTFNLMAGFTSTDFSKRIDSYRLLATADPREWGSQEEVWYRYYWNGSNNSVPEVNEALINGQTIPVGWVGDGARPQDISEVHTDFGYVQAAVNARLFKNRLNLVLAVRHDDLAISQDYNRAYSDYPENWDGSTVHYLDKAPANFLDLSEAEKAKYSPPDLELQETTFSTGGVWRLTNSFSLFANYATGFNPPASETKLRLDGTVMPTPISKGWDAGIWVSLLDDKLQASVSRYEAEETAQTFQISFSNHFENLAEANVVGDLSPEGMNKRGFPLVPAQPYDQRDLHVEGTEFEVVANLTRNWRLSANAAFADASSINGYQDSLAFLAQWDSVIPQIVTDAGGVFDASTGRAQVNGSIPEDQRPDADAAVNAYNQIYFNFLPNIATEAGKNQKLLGLTEMTANIFTHYKLTQGVLKGFKVGLGANYRGEKVVGFRGLDTIQDPDKPGDPRGSAAIDDPAVDEYTPVYGDPYWTATLTLSYQMELSNDRDLRFQLRVSNLFDEDQVIYGTRTHQMAPGGDFVNTAARVATPTRFRWQEPRSLLFTTTLSF